MLEARNLMAFVAVTDGKVARAFYEGTLGLAVAFEDDFSLIVQTPNVTLRVLKVKALTPQPFTVLGWAVDDVASAVDQLAQRGVKFERYPGMEQDERGIWTAPSGARIAWFQDPFGNLLSLTQ
jgi:catechol 2,3-dioxygenase-like lactoylglutathione lyase family enzyme